MQAFGGFGRAVSKEDEVALLKNKADSFKEHLEDTQVRIQAIEGKQGSKQK